LNLIKQKLDLNDRLFQKNGERKSELIGKDEKENQEV
jgi:hypothetical protein